LKRKRNTQKINVGTDITEISGFRCKQVKANLSFYNSIFNRSELMYCLKYSDPYPHLAGIFAAKEAVIKCFDSPIRMIDIEIVRYTDGRPIAVVRHNKKTTNIEISISHSQSLAIAVAILLS
jgi:phosphopantetheine--protein transferase-like protein